MSTAAVLLLNASYEPLSVIPKRRAMSLLLRGRVDAATDEKIAVQGTSTSFEIPTVIRLRRYINVPRRGARWSRMGVLRRDDFTCIYCGIKFGDVQRSAVLNRHDFTIDHIIPVSRGGKNTWGNTACACPRFRKIDQAGSAILVNSRGKFLRATLKMAMQRSWGGPCPPRVSIPLFLCPPSSFPTAVVGKTPSVLFIG